MSPTSSPLPSPSAEWRAGLQLPSYRTRLALVALPLSAAILVLLSAWKLTRARPKAPDQHEPQAVRSIPRLALHDASGNLVRLDQRVGRSKMLIVFFQATRSFDDSPALNRLLASVDAVRRVCPEVLAVGTQQSALYRQWMTTSPLPFPVLSDVLQTEQKAWGLPHPQTGRNREAIFVIDRAGYLRQSFFEPDLGSAEDWIRELSRIP